MSVVNSHNGLGSDGEDMSRSKREVLAYRLTAERPHTVSAGVAGILKTYGEITMVCSLNIAAGSQPAHDDSAVAAAPALQIPPSPSRRGQPQLELNGRRDVTFHQTELGSLRRSRFGGRGLHTRRRLGHGREVVLHEFGAIKYWHYRSALRDRHHLHRFTQGAERRKTNDQRRAICRAIHERSSKFARARASSSNCSRPSGSIQRSAINRSMSACTRARNAALPPYSACETAAGNGSA